MDNRVSQKRISKLNAGQLKNGPVLYWMSRDQRCEDNWALLYAQDLAIIKDQPLAVAFCLVSDFLGATWRQYDFMLQGLQQTAKELEAKGIPFYLLVGDPLEMLPEFINEVGFAAVISDYDPLRKKRSWRKKTAAALRIPFYEVDAHNIVPCRYASSKQEYGAYTLRPKIKRQLPEFLEDFPALTPMSTNGLLPTPDNDFSNVLGKLSIDRSVKPVTWIKPGAAAGHAMLADFMANKLSRYHLDRNDPNLDAQSNLSPYLHFGQVAPQRVALTVKNSEAPEEAKAAFLEELIIRRELADNFCSYNEHYDSFHGFPSWGQKTLNDHREDLRKNIYSTAEFEQGKTHDSLWNAAQKQMTEQGKMHGYLRMYWAKKILEWSESPEEAVKTAAYLNDRYELDGRDPNGYVGIAWSIGGVHDRPWRERPIFGKIRFMNYNGAKRKFNVDKFVQSQNQYDLS